MERFTSEIQTCKLVAGTKLSWTTLELWRRAYETAGPIIRAILQHAQTIYLKGSEKINWLSNFLGSSLRIVNLETLDCPALEKIDDTSSAECFHH